MEIEFDVYRKHVEETLKPKIHFKKILILGLVSEIGSVQSCIKKILRDRNENKPIEEVDKNALAIEIGDVLWYINAICHKYNFNTNKILLSNLNRIKKDQNVIINDYPNLKHLDLSHLKKLSIPENINSFGKYQKIAAKTNLIRGKEPKVLFEYCYLLNLVAHKIYKIFISKGRLRLEDLQNRLGDLYWYISALAKHYNISLDNVADKNMTKVKKLYLDIPIEKSFDFDRKHVEQLPEELTVYFYNKDDEISYIVINSILLGDPLDDNAKEEDGYRYHDGIHFVIYALLGWSPVWRGFLRRKRKEKLHPQDKTDQAEDGARARIVEEMIVKLIHSYFEKIKGNIRKGSVSSNLLNTIEMLSEGLEIENTTYAQWERIIIRSQKIYRKLVENKGGKLIIDLKNKKIEYKKISKKFKFRSYN